MMEAKKDRISLVVMLLLITSILMIIGGICEETSYKKTDFSGKAIDEPTFQYAKKAIKQKAEDVAKQIEIYLKAHPNETIKDLQKDPYFQEIAVQQVGKTGYTAVTDYNTLICRFHKNPKIVNLDLKTLSKKLPGFWAIMSKTKGGKEAEGVYDWIEPDGSIRQKYMYIAIVKTKTADNVGLSVAATTYLDEYSKPEHLLLMKKVSANIFWVLAIVTILMLLITLFVHKHELISFKRKEILVISIVFLALIIAGFVYLNFKSFSAIKKNEISMATKNLDIKIKSEKIDLEKNFQGLLINLKLIATGISNNDFSEETGLKKSYLRNEGLLYAVCRTNKSGEIIDIFPQRKNHYGMKILSQQEIEKTKNKMPAISSVFSSNHGFKSIKISYPLFKNQTYLGAIVYLINLEKFKQNYTYIGTDETQAFYFLDGKQSTIFADNKELISNNNSLIQKILLSNKKTFENQNFIAVKEPITFADRTFYLIYIADKNKILQDTLKEINKQWILVCLIILLFIISALILNSLATKSLSNELEEKTKELRVKIAELEKTKIAIMNMMEDLKETNRKLKELDKMKSQFLNIVSHELKTPLTAIIAHLEVLGDLGKNLTKEEKESLEAIRRNANNLKMIIGNILEIARIEAGKFELIFSKVNLESLIKNVIEKINILAKQKNLEIKTKISRIPLVECDENRVEEIITNLISNAIKFTEKGFILIKARKIRDYVEVSVSDTGVGIPKDKIDKLFHKFYQVDPSLSRRYGGTGLGLAITKKLIEAHSGTIKVKSKEGEGATFIFTLPIKQKKKKKQDIKTEKTIKSIGKFEDLFSKYDAEIRQAIKENKNKRR